MSSEISSSKDGLKSFAETIRSDIDTHLAPVLAAAEASLTTGDMTPLALGNDELHAEARRVGEDVDRKLALSMQYLKDLIDGMTFMAAYAEAVGADHASLDDENGAGLADPSEYALRARETLEFRSIDWS